MCVTLRQYAAVLFGIVALVYNIWIKHRVHVPQVRVMIWGRVRELPSCIGIHADLLGLECCEYSSQALHIQVFVQPVYGHKLQDPVNSVEIIVHLGLQFHVRHTSTVSAKLGKANLCRSSNLDDTNKLKLQENYKNWNIAKLRMKHRSACSQCWATTAPGTKGNREWHFLHLTGRMHLLSVVSHPWLYTILVFHCELLALPLALEHGETLYSLPSAPGSKCS